MKFPNLLWALSQRGFSHWRFAARLRMEPTAFSRRLNGRSYFTPAEKHRIAELLRYPVGWLFEEPAPPIDDGGKHDRGTARSNLQTGQQ